MTSVFPSTTSAALSSLMTGVAPLQHAMTGWFMYFKELATAGVALPFQARFTETSLDNLGVNIEDILNFETAFKKVNKSMTLITPGLSMNSAYSNYCYANKPKQGYETLPECFNLIKTQVLGSHESELVYVYIPQFDHNAHNFGINSGESVALFKQIDDLFTDLLNETKDTETLYIVTADHGLIDTSEDKKLYLSDFPDVQECLILPLLGEPRVPYCYVRPSLEKQFISAVDSQLGEFCDRYSAAEVMNMSLYGLGEVNPKFFGRIGDHILFMKENYVLLDKVYCEQHKPFIGFHGGLTKEEMLVPLIVVRN
jgi:predicted AlkP superfamily pyrophosphatase or phosphodiesterase